MKIYEKRAKDVYKRQGKSGGLWIYDPDLWRAPVGNPAGRDDLLREISGGASVCQRRSDPRKPERRRETKPG